MYVLTAQHCKDIKYFQTRTTLMGIELTKFEISFNLSKKLSIKNFHKNFRSPRKTRCYRQIPRKFLINSSKKMKRIAKNRMPATPGTLTSLKRTLTSSALSRNATPHSHFIRAFVESYSSSAPSWKVFHVILEQSVHDDF